MPHEESLELSIQGMHCDACVRRVTKALADVPSVAVQQVEVGGASLKYDAARVSPSVIAAAVNAIGFEVVDR